MTRNAEQKALKRPKFSKQYAEYRRLEKASPRDVKEKLDELARDFSLGKYSEKEYRQFRAPFWQEYYTELNRRGELESPEQYILPPSEETERLYSIIEKIDLGKLQFGSENAYRYEILERCIRDASEHILSKEIIPYLEQNDPVKVYNRLLYTAFIAHRRSPFLTLSELAERINEFSFLLKKHKDEITKTGHAAFYYPHYDLLAEKNSPQIAYRGNNSPGSTVSYNQQYHNMLQGIYGYFIAVDGDRISSYVNSEYIRHYGSISW